MAITETRVARALENYIPSSIAVSKDPKTNASDPEEAFKKLQTMVSVALVLDPNSLFYLLSIVLSEVLSSADSLISSSQSLSSQEVLLSSEQTLPSRITDTTDLLRASSAISDLASSSSSEAAQNLSDSITSFQANQLKDLTQRRNIKLVEDDIRALAATMRTSLNEITTYLARVTSAIDDYENIDVKGVALAHVAETARIRILQIQQELEEASVEEQAELAESILVDLAAAKVALGTISEAKNPRGGIVIPVTADGSTKQTYLTAQGTGALIPRTYVAKGSEGGFFIDYLLASTQGTASAAEYEVTAFLDSEERLTFPIKVSSPGDLVLTVNGSTETISFGATTFFTAANFVSYYNSVATISQAYETGDSVRPIAIHAYDPSSSSNPVGADSSISVDESSSEAVLAALSISSTASSVGSLTSAKVVEGGATLSSLTFPSTTTTFAGTSNETFDCTLTTLDGVVRKIVAVDTVANSITVSPPMRLAVVTDSSGSVTYEAGPFSYVVTKTAAGTLFQSGGTSNTTPLVTSPNGTSFDSFLLTSAGATGATDTTRIQHPNSDSQATNTLSVSAATAPNPGDTITIDGIVLTAVSGSPTTVNTFEASSTMTAEEKIQSLADAINSSANDLTETCTAEASGLVLTLTAVARGTAGNSISYSSTFGAISPTATVPGQDRGQTWDGIGDFGALERILRTSGSDGTNKKEGSVAGKVGERVWSGTAGVAYKTYASGTSANWYKSNAGTWGDKISEVSTGAIGTVPSPTTPSPSGTSPTNVFYWSSTASYSWANNAQFYWAGTGYNSIVGNSSFWLHITSWVQQKGSVSGPITGVGGSPIQATGGVGGPSLFITNSTGSLHTVRGFEVDSSGDGVSDGDATSWNELGWSYTAASGAPGFNMSGYVFDADVFKGLGFTSSYTTETGTFTPQAGDTLFWEKGSARDSATIDTINTSLKVTLTTPASPEDYWRFGDDDPTEREFPKVETGVSYTISRDTTVDSTKFFASSASSSVNLTSKGVRPGDLLYISTAGSNQGWYVIDSVLSDGELLIDTSASGNAPDNTAFKTAFSYPQNVSWEIRRPDYQQRVTDSTATFLSNGVQSGDTIVISTGTWPGSYEIDAVETETSLRVVATNPSYNGGPFTNTNAAGETVTYYVPQNDSLGGETNEFFRSPSSSFYGTVFVGDILAVGGLEYEVESIEDTTILKINALDSGPSTFSSYFDGEAFTIRRGKETSGTYSGQETTNAFKVAISFEPSLTDLKDVNGIEIGSRIDINPTGTPNRKDGYLVIREGDAAGTYSISSVSDVSGGYQYIYLDTYLPFTTPLSYTTEWEVIAGTTTRVFLDTGTVDRFSGSISSSSSFSNRAPKVGDQLLVEFSDGTTRYIAIQSVDFEDQLTLEEELTQSLSGISYSLLPVEYPQIGQELVVGGYRRVIEDIRLATSAGGSSETAVLQLASPLPLTLGSDLSYFVVTPGADPFSAFLEDSNPNVLHDSELSLSNGFKSSELGNLVGRAVQISNPKGSFSTSVQSVVDSSTLRLANPVEALLDTVFYRIVTEEPGKSGTLTHDSEIVTEVVPGDYLSLWQTPMYQVVTSKSNGEVPDPLGLLPEPQYVTNINFSPQADSGLSNLDFVVTRGGASSYGKYLLLLHKIDNLNQRLNNYEFSDLNLRLAEVIATNGSDRSEVLSPAATSGTVATAPDDGDGDSTTNRFDVSVNASQSLEGVRIGDRISVTYQNATTLERTTLVCWVSLQEFRFTTDPLDAYDELERGDSFGSEITRCLVFPEIPVSTDEDSIVSWSIERNSISFALNEAAKIRLLAEEVRDIVELYSVEASSNVDAALSLLESEGYDRLSSLLKTGQLSEFFGTGYTSGTYQDLMASTIREAGALLLELKNG